MTNTIRTLIILFAASLFWVFSVEAFAATKIQRCFDAGHGVMRCIQPDGSMITIVKS